MHRRNGSTKIQRFLCILPADSDAFLRPYTLINKTVLALLMIQLGSPFAVPDAMLPFPADELLTRVRMQFAQSIHEHKIELRSIYKSSLSQLT